MSKVSIIIVTYNGLKWLSKCLASCEAYTVIVVDNNSTDATVQFIQENYPSITLLKQTKNLGFGAANNIGISYALKQGADYVFLLNQDAYLEENTIETLINIHKENEEYGILSPIHLNGDGTSLDFNFSNYINVNKQLQYDSLKHSFFKTIYQVPFVNAAAWLLPRKTLEIIGGFDPIFYHYAEDDNYCQRVIYHGFKIGVVPNTYIYHDREHREIKTFNNVAENWVKRERFLKLKWANVNLEVEEEIMAKKRKLEKLIIKLIVKLKFRKANYYIKELKLTKNITPEILKSRKINSKAGKNYIT